MKHIIPKGVLHARKNNIPEHLDLGKKGIPVVQVKEGGELEKVAEIEHEELIFNKEVASKIEELVYKYIKTPDDNLLVLLGKLVKQELLNNTEDKTKKFLNSKYLKEVSKTKSKYEK